MANPSSPKRRRWKEVYRGPFAGGEAVLAISDDQIRLDVPRGYAARTVFNVDKWTQVQLVPLPGEVQPEEPS
jgi:hypothetical protein